MSAKGIRKISTFGSRLTSIVSVCLVLVLLGMAAMIGLAARSVSDDVKRNLGFTIVMEREFPAAGAEELNATIEQFPGVNLTHYLTAEEILAAETEALGGDLAIDSGVNPYAAEIEVKVTPEYATSDSINTMIAKLSGVAGIEEIITESAVIAGVERSLARAWSILLIVAVILLAVSIALINNTVSLSIYSKRFTIHTMKLVGATAGFIRAPFVRAGAINGLVAGLVADAVLVGVRAYGSTLEPMTNSVLPWGGVGIIAVILILVGIAVCSLTSYFATNRYLAISYDEMFLK